MKNLGLALFALVFGFASYAEKGSPLTVKCAMSKLVYKEEIKELTDIETLLQDSKRVRVETKEVECDTYQGEVTVCENEFDVQGFYSRYHFNSQSGALELEDRGTGQATYMNWMNQYEVTDSGYLLGGTWLTNRRGGLMGDARVFQVDVDCWATSWKPTK